MSQKPTPLVLFPSKRGREAVVAHTALRQAVGSDSDGRATGILPLCVILLTILILSACGGGSGGGLAPRPFEREPPPSNEGFTPAREGVVVDFSEFSSHASALERRFFQQEAARVSAMHQRGGTGRGEIVGIFDLGANPGHVDLRGQYAHRCAMGLCNGTTGSDDDGRASLDRHQHSPLNDVEGHGTSVHGVVAAKRNGTGIYGVAFDARIASYGVSAPVPWDDGCASFYDNCKGKSHAWGSIFDRQIARGVDWMGSLGVRTINNSWFRTYPWSQDRGLTAGTVRDIMPLTLPAFEKYVANGGVVVFSSGNFGTHNHPDVEAVLPLWFPHLERGWLAVAALGRDGFMAGYSQRCGVAADWCIAAPGDVITTELGGRWEITGGTSIAAPYVTASLAALKSMFPNLSYQDVRKRLLVTADRSGPYGETALYGQGRLNLDAASRPVGGTNFALGALDSGPTLSTGGASIVLPRQAIERYLAGRTITVLDGYQRAPFEVGLDAFAAPRRAPYLSMDDLAIAPHRFHRAERDGGATVAAAGAGYLAQGLAEGQDFVGFGRGPEVARALARLAGGPLTSGDYRMSRDAAGVALGFAGSSGGWHALAVSGTGRTDGPGFGVMGWNPKTLLAVSFAPDRAAEVVGAEAFGVSFASKLERPMGLEGSGAMSLGGDSVEFAWKRNLADAETFRVDLTNRLTHLAVRSGPLLQFDDALLASAMLEVSYRPHRFVTVGGRLGTERPVSPVAGRIRAAGGVDETGRIAYRDVAIDGRGLLSFDKASLSVGYADGSNASFGLGVAAVRDGFGRTEALAGVRMDLVF